MIALPKGYFAVQNDFENASKDSFTYMGITYAVTEGVNLFPSLAEANKLANEIPTEILEGLPYEQFTTPVVLFSKGTHKVDLFEFDHPLSLLGNRAGINPNLPSPDRREMPALNEARANEEEETRFLGSFWHGRMFIKVPAATTVIFDGITLESISFRDVRRTGGACLVAFRNILYKGPCGWSIHEFGQADPNGDLAREVEITNARAVGYYDYDYAGNFILLNARKTTLDNICYASTGQVFGFSNKPRTYSNCATNGIVSEITLKNSYFADMSGYNGVCTGCFNAGERAVGLTVSNTSFIDASRQNEAPLAPHLLNDNCTLNVNDCLFCDSRGSTSSAIAIFGTGNNVTLENCEYEGFAALCDHLPVPPSDAPDYLEARDEAWETNTEDAHRVLPATKDQFTFLDTYYRARKPYYGDLHVHTNCGGTSDGKLPMAQWVPDMDKLDLDFAAVVDHRQMRGFFLPEWSEERFIIGTEPGTRITDLNAVRAGQNSIHYNMLFPNKYGLAMVLANFPEFSFKGDELTGSFTYPKFTKERFFELGEYVRSIGGVMVHPHPKLALASDDPMDYYIGEHTYLETLYGSYTSHSTYKNYELWVALLAAGKHVYASSGSDSHGAVSNNAPATFYTHERSGNAFLAQMRTGDYTVGGVGIKMCIDEHPMGSEIEWKEGMKLTVRIEDFYKHTWKDKTAYEVRVVTDRGVAYSSMFNGKIDQKLVLEVQKRAFYRVEIYDLTHDCWIAHGNPIWIE